MKLRTSFANSNSIFLRKSFQTVLFICTIFTTLSAQSVLDLELDGSEQNLLLLDFLQEFEKDKPVQFFYTPEWFGQIRIEEDYKGKTLNDALNVLLSGTGINFVEQYGYAVIFFKNPSQDLFRETVVKSALKRDIVVDNLVIGNAAEFKPGKKCIIKGVVEDDGTGAALTNASVYVNGLNVSASTDAKGNYQLTLPSGEYVITFRFIKYDEKLVNVAVYGNGTLNVKMEESPITLEEIIISDKAPVTAKPIGQISFKMIDIKRAPALMGQPDIIKQIQTQPGISTVSEASSGFNVRGGGVDQNLVLFDGVPIFNTAHALGFFTAFNSDAINEASFYKGGIPAEFGGRVSSVLTLTSKDGGYQKWSGSGGIGPITSNLTIGGPIKRDTSSIIASFRTSYSDWVLNLLKTKYQGINNGSIFFYDGSLKYASKLDNRSNLTVSAYTSHDRFKLSKDTANQWQNIAASIRYDHTAKNNIFYSAGLYFGNYTYRVTGEDTRNAFTLDYKITHPSLKLDFIHEGDLHKQSFGFHSTFYSFSPGTIKPTSSQSAIDKIAMPRENSLESAFYFSDAFSWSDRFHIEAGLRLSIFNRLGPGTVYKYLDNAPLEKKNMIDSVQYKAGSIMKTYLGPEPRLSLRYTIDQQTSLKLGYNRMYQYVHLISNTAAVTPVDIWQSSNTYFKPQIADQVSAGIFRNTKNETYEFFAEAYYKYLQNVLDFKNGANLILNKQLETALLRGKGKSYGAEFSVNKIKGKLTGNLNYTYSRSFRQVNGAFDVDKINNGNQYPSNFDQPHIVNLNWRYSFTKRFFFSGTFTYHTGRPVTLPVGGYKVGGIPVSDFSDRNNYRIPDYHRLDLALILEGNYTKKRFKGSWVLSVFNVYGRKNPYSVFFTNGGNGYLEPYQLSIIGVAVPSLSYNFKF